MHDWYWEICPVTQVTGLFFDGTHADVDTCNLRCLGKSNPSALAALCAFFKEIGDEQ